MRRSISVMGVLTLLLLPLCCLGEPAKEAPFSSKKPLYAKVAVTEDASKVLCVAFDESKGAGEGYDALYADANFNGRFEESEKLTASIHRCSPTGIHCNYAAVKLNVPYNNKGAGISDPCEVTFNYARHSLTTAVESVGAAVRVLGVEAEKSLKPSLSKTTVNEDFYVSAGIKLQGSAQWQYTFSSSIKPSESLQSAPLWSFNQAPQLKVTAKPDPNKEGQLGIALESSAGEVNLGCNKDGAPTKARVEVKAADGKVVHQDEGELSKYGFG